MEVNDKIMYHYHRMGIYDERWGVGNNIIVNNSFNLHFWEMLPKFSTAAMCNSDN